MANKIPENEVAVFRRVSKDGEHAPHGFMRIKADEQLFRKPTLLCCGGMFINKSESDGEKNCNGFAKIGHGLLCFPQSFPVGKANTFFKPDIDIVSVCYPQGAHSLAQDFHASMRELKEGRQETPTEFAKKFAARHLFPLVEDKDGNPLSLQTMKRNLRNIQVLSHSYGSTFIQHVGNVLADRLAQHNLSPEQSHDVTSQVLVVSVGSITPPATGRAHFTTVNILNTADTEIRNSYDLQPAILELFKGTDLLVDRKNEPVSPRQDISRDRYYGYYPAKPLNIMPIKAQVSRDSVRFTRAPESNHWLACASQPLFMNGIGEIIPVPVLPDHERSDERGIIAENASSYGDRTYHQPESYFTYKRQRAGVQATAPSEHTEHATTLRNLMSSLLINGMNNAVQNAHGQDFMPLPPANALMSLPQVTEYQTSLDVPLRRTAKLDKYDEKITAALSEQRPEPQVRKK